MEKETLGRLLAARLREIRTAKGLSQRGLAKAGINHKYYQRIESGNVNVTLRTIERLAAALGVRVIEIFQQSGRSATKKRIKKPVK